MTFKLGDVVTFADGITARKISGEVGGPVDKWAATLTAGDTIVSISPGGRVSLKESGMWCYARCLQLMDPSLLEPDTKWATKWAQMMEE